VSTTACAWTLPRASWRATIECMKTAPAAQVQCTTQRCEAHVERKRRRGCARWIAWAIVLLAAVLIAMLAISRTPRGRAVYNIIEYRLRAWSSSHFPAAQATASPPGAIAGKVSDSAGQPLEGALVLVATSAGEAHTARSDSTGGFRIVQVPPGRYVVAASAWGYDDAVHRRGPFSRSAVTVRPAKLTDGLNVTLSEHVPFAPELEKAPIVGPPEIGVALFPAEVQASRMAVTFTNESLVITTTLLYEPLQTDQADNLPVLVACYPSEPLNWDRVSVAIASEGYMVLATGPSPQRGLDIPGMARDHLKAAGYLRAGQLTDRADMQRQGWLSGSFSSVILYQSLREQPGNVDALIVVGGISDALLGVQALYGQDLAIPERYATAIAALGRPDRYPEVYLGYSPAFFAKHLPPTLVVHTTADEVIPPDQAERLAAALDEAGVPYELFLYEDTTHYLDQVNVTPDTAELYRRLTEFLDRYVRQAPG